MVLFFSSVSLHLFIYYFVLPLYSVFFWGFKGEWRNIYIFFYLYIYICAFLFILHNCSYTGLVMYQLSFSSCSPPLPPPPPSGALCPPPFPRPRSPLLVTYETWKATKRLTCCEEDEAARIDHKRKSPAPSWCNLLPLAITWVGHLSGGTVTSVHPIWFVRLILLWRSCFFFVFFYLILSFYSLFWVFPSVFFFFFLSYFLFFMFFSLFTSVIFFILYFRQFRPSHFWWYGNMKLFDIILCLSLFSLAFFSFQSIFFFPAIFITCITPPGITG